MHKRFVCFIVLLFSCLPSNNSDVDNNYVGIGMSKISSVAFRAQGKVDSTYTISVKTVEDCCLGEYRFSGINISITDDTLSLYALDSIFTVNKDTLCEENTCINEHIADTLLSNIGKIYIVIHYPKNNDTLEYVDSIEIRDTIIDTTLVNLSIADLPQHPTP
jgi:hypothetical protein